MAGSIAVAAAATVTTTATTVAAAASAAATVAPTASAAATAASAAAVATAAAPRPFFARLGLIDGESAALIFGPVHRLDGFIRSRGHFNEPEASASAGLPVRNDLGLRHRAVLAEQLRELLFG